MAQNTPGDGDNSGAANAGNFEALGRQYWNAWGDLMRQSASGFVQTGQSSSAGVSAGFGVPDSALPDWKRSMDWWSQLAHGQRAEANAAVERMTAQTRDWFGAMQGVANRFAGQDAAAPDIARAWKEALGAAGENPFPEMLRSMRGHGLQGLDQWIEDASPYLDAWRRESSKWLGVPAFGFAREHQQRQQKLLLSYQDYQQRTGEYNALLARSLQRGFELFEHKLAEREEPGRQLRSARALFDLWIDAAEEGYAQVALSPEFRQVYGALGDAQMRLRAGIQREVEQLGGMFGMPTRTEVDSAHRKISQLEREVRKLRDAQAAMTSSVSAPVSVAASPKPRASASNQAKRSAPRPAVKKVAAATPKSRTKPQVKAVKPAVKKAPAGNKNKKGKR